MSQALTPEQQAHTPVLPPPPGVVPNYEHPQWRVPEIYGVGITFMTIATIMYMIRVYTKVFIWKAWRWEDTTITLGLLTTLTYFVIMAWSAYNGSIGKHSWEIYLSTANSDGSFLAVQMSFALLQPAYLFIKGSLFLQYWHLFNPVRWMRIGVYIGLTIVVGFYTAMTIILFWAFTPHNGESRREAIFSDHWILGARLVMVPGVIGIILDWYLLILPIPVVYRLKLSRPKKLGVITVFMTGLLACAASIITLYLRVGLAGTITDPSWDVVPVIIWALIELTCGIITANAPFVHLLWNRHGKTLWITLKIKSSLRTAISLGPHSHSRHARLDDPPEGPHRQSLPFTKNVQLNPLADDSLFLSHTFSFERSTTHSETTKAHSYHESDRSEVEPPLPVHLA